MKVNFKNKMFSTRNNPEMFNIVSGLSTNTYLTCQQQIHTP